MSNVPRSQRSQSSAQFVQTARELVKITLSRYNTSNKKMKDYLKDVLLIPVTRMYRDIMFIRRLYSKDDTNSILRIKLCQKTLGTLDYIASMLDLIYLSHIDGIQGSSGFTENQWSSWINTNNEESALIYGLMRKEIDALRKRHFNPLNFEDDSDRKRWQDIEDKLGISIYEDELNERLNQLNDL
ncbi:MAG: hypothetical protein RR342_01020 [Bacilli bacterium]